MPPIVILIVLTLPTVLAFTICKASGAQFDITKYAHWGVGVAFIIIAIGQTTKTEEMIAMLPAWLPFHLQIIYLTGALKLTVGVGLLIKATQNRAAKVALLIFMFLFPVNIYFTIHPIGLVGYQWGPIDSYFQALLQLVLMIWTYFLCVEPQNTNHESTI